jgi:preprotein translocase subunit YajC
VKRSEVVSELASLLPLVGIAVLFWLLLVRPQQRRQRELRQMQSSLGVGDRVMLTSGIYGVLRSLADDSVRVELAPGVVVEVARGAVGQRLAPLATEPVHDEHDEHDEQDGADREPGAEPGTTETTEER